MTSAYQHLNTGGDYEIQICLTCPLPDCQPTSKICPLRIEEAKLKKDMFLFIKRNEPVEREQIQAHFNLDKKRTAQILALLVNNRLVKGRQNEPITIKKKDLST